MSEELQIPDFGALLGPVVEGVPDALVPVLLAGLERAAAARYRHWAGASGDPEEARALLACATREEEIASRVEKRFPASEAERQRVETLLPEAVKAFLAVFDPHPVRDQYRIQASAERQGAAAWRGLARDHPDAAVRGELEGCAALEEASASALEEILAR